MKKVFFAVAAFGLLCAAVAAVWLAMVLRGLPDVAGLKHYRPPAAAEVLDCDGRALAEYFDRKYRISIPLASLPEIVIKAVVTAEDDTFFAHDGVNYKATWDAFVHDVRKRRFARGGSTITQQMIKNVLLTREKTLSRKIREYILARQAEEILTKRQILQIYMNEVEWGDHIHGIEAASRFYFDKHASELSVAEAALLAGMLPNPRYYNPYRNPQKAKKRQEQVLFNMHQAKLIPSDVYRTSLDAPVPLREQSSSRFSFPALESSDDRPCYYHVLEQFLIDRFGESEVYRGGLRIKTSIDRGLQDEMNRLEEDSEPLQELPEELTVILQENRIKAVLCSPGKEESVRERLSFHGLDGMDYQVVPLPRDSLAEEMLVLSVDGRKKRKP